MTETVHACPPGLSGVTPCCGRTPFELPRTDRMTTDPQAVTCTDAPTPGLTQCPTCGPKPTEPHPRQPVDRCSNCKTHAPGVAPIPGRCNGCGHTDDEGCTCSAHGFVSREHCHRCDGTWLIKNAAEEYARSAPAPDGLRDRYAAAIREWHGDWTKDTFADAADAVIAVRDEELQRLRAETATADQIRADVQRERDRLREELAASDETARRLLERHQELAAERYAWQERGLKAEATIARMKRTNRMVNGGARDARERAEKAEAANERVRALHDSLCRTDALTNPDDLITRGAAADRIATALDTSATPEDPS